MIERTLIKTDQTGRILSLEILNVEDDMDIILDEENPKLEITNYLTTNNININEYMETLNNNRNFEENLYFINGELKIINMYDFLAFIPQENK